MTAQWSLPADFHIPPVVDVGCLDDFGARRLSGRETGMGV